MVLMKFRDQFALSRNLGDNLQFLIIKGSICNFDNSKGHLAIFDS